MKKLTSFIVMLALVLMAGSASAQIKFGIKGGLNFDNFSGGIKSSTGWHAGLISKITIPIVGLGVQPELLYSVSKPGDGSIGYVQIPVNLRFQLLPGPIRPILLAGPYWGYAVNFGGGLNADFFAKSDWGIGVGAGLEVFKFQLALKYDVGMQKIIGDTKNNAVRLSLGYFF